MRGPLCQIADSRTGPGRRGDQAGNNTGSSAKTRPSLNWSLLNIALIHQGDLPASSVAYDIRRLRTGEPGTVAESMQISDAIYPVCPSFTLSVAIAFRDI